MTHEKIARSLTFDRDLQREIVSALRQVEQDALERAAQVLDELHVEYLPADDTGDRADFIIARNLADAAQQIRSLKEQTQAEDSEGVR
jgi:hypothetical protein